MNALSGELPEEVSVIKRAEWRLAALFIGRACFPECGCYFLVTLSNCRSRFMLPPPLTGRVTFFTSTSSACLARSDFFPAADDFSVVSLMVDWFELSKSLSASARRSGNADGDYISVGSTCPLSSPVSFAVLSFTDLSGSSASNILSLSASLPVVFYSLSSLISVVTESPRPACAGVRVRGFSFLGEVSSLEEFRV